MSEDDTFEALRRTPFRSLIKLITYEIHSSIGPDDLIRIWAKCHEKQCAMLPTSYWLDVYKVNGWTFEELLEESHREVTMMEDEH